MKSDKPIKLLSDILGKQTFFFPDDLANERVGNDFKKCILVRVNGQSHHILTGVNTELSAQDFAILRDSGIVNNIFTYTKDPYFDPLRP